MGNSKLGLHQSLSKLDVQSADNSKYKRNKQLRSPPKKVNMNIQENLLQTKDHLLQQLQSFD